MVNLIRFNIPNKDSNKPLYTNKNEIFQSFIISLLYIVKNSRPDIKNSVSELLKIIYR